MENLNKALQAIQQGEFVVLLDDKQREDEADLVIAAEHLNYDKLNFMAREAGGFICIPMLAERLNQLKIPLMVKDNNSQFQTPFTITVEAAKGVTTGVSIADRLTTIQCLVDEATTPNDIVMPGHIFPLCANEQGVLARQGHTEGSVDLCRLAGCKPIAAICELMDVDGTMLRGKKLLAFAAQYQMPIIDIASIRQHRLLAEPVVEHVVETPLPMNQCEGFTIHGFIDHLTGQEHVALSKLPLSDNPLVRVHSSCVTGDILSSLRCDCHQQLHQSLALINEQGGMLLYLEQEGRGIGLIEKLKTYVLQNEGLDTVEANLKLGHSVDRREYYAVVHMLNHFNITSLRLVTNNPDKMNYLQQQGFSVERYPSFTNINPHNQRYLQTKKEKCAHWLEESYDHH